MEVVGVRRSFEVRDSRCEVLCVMDGSMCEKMWNGMADGKKVSLNWIKAPRRDDWSPGTPRP